MGLFYFLGWVALTYFMQRKLKAWLITEPYIGVPLPLWMYLIIAIFASAPFIVLESVI